MKLKVEMEEKKLFVERRIESGFIGNRETESKKKGRM